MVVMDPYEILCPQKAAKTSNCLIRTPFLRHLSRRVVRVEIGQKPGVVRGTGSSNPSPSSGESIANLTCGAAIDPTCRTTSDGDWPAAS